MKLRSGRKSSAKRPKRRGRNNVLGRNPTNVIDCTGSTTAGSGEERALLYSILAIEKVDSRAAEEGKMNEVPQNKRGR